ncbi:MAG: HDOD domain-containing protein, partial [Bacteroidales bacterium]|nr:HDOD domain-containing protein [Bacteroidales bacterium]
FSIERKKKKLMNELNFLPPVPSNFVRILSVISDKNSSAADLEKYIESDKALFQKMIKISNSSFYRAGSSSSEVETSRQSIMTLGFNMIEALTLVTGTNKLFPKRMLSYGYVNEGLWHHSLACSVIAKSIAVDMHLSKYRVDDLFLCGLFHDIGKTILGKYLAFKDKIFLFPELGENNKSQMEKNFTGYSHAEIGEMLIKNWKLPAIVEYTTKNHHQPFLSLTYAKEICIINLADYVANYLKIGFHYRNTYKPVLLDTVKRTLEIDENYVETLIKRSITLYKDISSMFTKIR